ncbi:MAG: GIY-YIG nuclease family protein, partial [Oscillospiraceae bacterium]|nr:GIY-YIG nuclease family protein [Oscillospiraceae bacterium]
MAEIVYILTNPVMPGVVKIGKTDKEEVRSRVKELFTTGVPVPFDCVYACVVENNETVEKALHRQFTAERINPRREFFWLASEDAVAALKP